MAKHKNTNPEHEEGPVATAIEEQTAKLPSDIFLWASLGAMAVSLALQATGTVTGVYLLANGQLLFCYWAYTTN